MNFTASLSETNSKAMAHTIRLLLSLPTPSGTSMSHNFFTTYPGLTVKSQACEVSWIYTVPP